MSMKAFQRAYADLAASPTSSSGSAADVLAHAAHY